MLRQLLPKLLDNRLTRPPKQWIVRSMAARRMPRAVLNWWYATLGEEGKSRFYERYAKIYRETGARLCPGEWTITFPEHRIKLPLRRAFSWLDWDNAVSILGHEIEIKRTYAALLASEQRPVFFLDVGANYGMHSVFFLAAGVPTIAFEPNRSCFACFQAVCELNGLSGRWESVAIGDRNGSTELVYPEKETWLGSISHDVISGLKGGNEVIREEVSVRRLDDYLSDIPRGRVILKIDVEAAELEVLQGASQILSIYKPKIIFESKRTKTRRDLYELLEQFGYSVHSLPWEPPVPSRRLGVGEFFASPDKNFIAIANGGPARSTRSADYSNVSAFSGEAPNAQCKTEGGFRHANQDLA